MTFLNNYFIKHILLSKISFRKELFLCLVFLTIFYLGLEKIYADYISVNFNYMGFIYKINLFKYIEAKLLFIVILINIIYLYNKNDFYYFVGVFWTYLIFIPTLVLFPAIDGARSPCYSIFFITLSFSLIPKIKFSIFTPKLNYSLNTFLFIILGILIVTYFYNLYGFSFNKNLLLLQVYETRYDFRSKSNFISSYLLPWASETIFPLAFVYFLYFKKYFFSILIFFAQFQIFLLAGHKGTLFSLFLIYFFYKFGIDYKKKVTISLCFLVVCIFVCPIIDFLTNSFLFSSLFIRRVFFIPALLNYYYFEFFHNNYLFLSHSILKSFFPYPFELLPSRLIGLQYFQSDLMNANNGFVTDAYMNFGFLGLFFYTIAFFILLKSYESMNINSKFTGILILILLNLRSSAFLTSLLTHGIILLFILMYFSIRNTN